MIDLQSINLKTNRLLIRDGNLHIPSHSISAIIGKSGTGKTSLLYLVGLLQPLSKELTYLFHGKDLHGVNLDDFRRKHIHFVFQDCSLFEHLSILENINIIVAMESKKVDQEELNYLLTRMNLNLDLNKNINEISGGQRQRLAILVAIIKHPDLIILDEPTSSLDKTNTDELMKLLQDMVKQYGFSILLTTHSKSILDYCDQIYEIENQQLTCIKKMSEVKIANQVEKIKSIDFKFFMQYCYYVLKNQWLMLIRLLVVNCFGLMLFFALPNYLNNFTNDKIAVLNEQFNPEVFIVNSDHPYYVMNQPIFNDDEIAFFNKHNGFKPYKELWLDQIVVDDNLLNQRIIVQYNPFYKEGEVIVPTSLNIKEGSLITINNQDYPVTGVQDTISKSYSQVTGTIILIGSDLMQEKSSAYLGKVESLQKLQEIMPDLMQLNKSFSYDYLTYNTYLTLQKQNHDYIIILQTIEMLLVFIMNLLIQRKFIHNRHREFIYLRINGINKKQFLFLNGLEVLFSSIMTLLFCFLLSLFKIPILFWECILFCLIFYSIRYIYLMKYLSHYLNRLLRS